MCMLQNHVPMCGFLVKTIRHDLPQPTPDRRLGSADRGVLRRRRPRGRLSHRGKRPGGEEAKPRPERQAPEGRRGAPPKVKNQDLTPNRTRSDRRLQASDRTLRLTARTAGRPGEGGGGRAQATVPGDPGADTTAAGARGGAGMTARPVETTGGRGGDGDGLRGSAMTASTQAALGRIMARNRPNYLADEQKRHLLMSRSGVKLSERPTKVVGWTRVHDSP